MNFCDASLPGPAENLAADEALLEACEAGGPEVLRFWEPEEYFVVLGFSNVAAREANLEACRREGVRVLRRCSGGGAVLQGRGCLNYALVLRIDDAHPAHTIPSTNAYIMERHRAALSRLLARPVTVQGISDLCIDSFKFSGNAQRRLRHALIFHGSFLLNFDLARMETFLATPSRQPDYRRQRTHRDFLINAPVSPALIKQTLRETWEAQQPLPRIPNYARLLSEKYSRDEWNLKR
jgi:lipoate-protein ligase A